MHEIPYTRKGKFLFCQQKVTSKDTDSIDESKITKNKAWVGQECRIFYEQISANSKEFNIKKLDKNAHSKGIVNL